MQISQFHLMIESKMRHLFQRTLNFTACIKCTRLIENRREAQMLNGLVEVWITLLSVGRRGRTIKLKNKRVEDA